ncbi:MAG: alpha/beta hydrolase [Actinomycetota bacterium]|nr:alpha/beta hydrolase [Actinomycetota bacterium]
MPDTSPREPAGPGGLRVIRREPMADGPAAGRLVVCVHGAMDRATSFTRLMTKLPDWTVVAYDRRGYGHSAHLGPPETFDQQVEDLLSVLDDQPAVAFGHSLGGDVVLATASRHPGLITAAVVWEPPQPWLSWWPSESAARAAGSELEPEERAEWFMRRMVGDRIWERLPPATREQRRSEGPTLSADIGLLSRAAVFDPHRIRIPVIVGRGGDSRPHQRRSARELAASLPHGQLAEIDGCGHGAHLSHPGEVAALLARVAALTC